MCCKIDASLLENKKLDKSHDENATVSENDLYSYKEGISILKYEEEGEVKWNGNEAFHQSTDNQCLGECEANSIMREFSTPNQIVNYLCEIAVGMAANDNKVVEGVEDNLPKLNGNAESKEEEADDSRMKASDESTFKNNLSIIERSNSESSHDMRELASHCFSLKVPSLLTPEICRTTAPRILIDWPLAAVIFIFTRMRSCLLR